ncbi:1-deoxy-D-xylulose-5-phosphate synthase [Thermodesulfobacteriota bacterium]
MSSSNKEKDTILGTIDSPADVQELSLQSLEDLAQEVRALIIENVSQTGGHLASNLGMVEITLAMLKVFSPPDDRIVFDVGHQAYPYKILTGRRDRFHTLRTKGGLSGFPKRSESPYDFFDVGHAGNAISYAAGLSQARCMQCRKNKVIAVVGDGSLTCGVSYEGLNQAGDAEKDLIIILNDNEMSISPNVGAMAAYLSRIMTGQVALRFRQEVKGILSSIGKPMYGLAKQMEEAVKGFITPGRLFEDLGFKYVGPIDGHRLDHLVLTLKNIQRFQEPVLVHAVTCKGKGYCEAEKHPSQFHGIGPFDVQTGETQKSEGPPSYTSVFGKAMVKFAAEDPAVVAVTAAMEHGTGLAEFARLYPDRFFDVGIAEQHGVIFAAGLAHEGFKPVVAIYSTFIQRGYDHLIHDVSMQALPVVFALDRGGVVGEDGPTHHGVFDLAFLRSIPNFLVMAPSDGKELTGMLHTALCAEQPCAIRYPRDRVPDDPTEIEPELIPIGKARTLADGDDLVIVAVGSMVYPALGAARILEKAGVSTGVVDARFVKPLDEKLICRKAAAAGNVITVEEGVLAGGFGSAVLECLADAGLDGVKVTRIGIPDRFVEHATRKELLEDLGLTPDGIAEKAQKMLCKNKESKLRCIS